MLGAVTLAAGKPGRRRVTLRSEEAIPSLSLETVPLSQPHLNWHPQSIARSAFHDSEDETISTLHTHKRLLIARVLELEELLRGYNKEFPPGDQYLRFVITGII